MSGHIDPEKAQFEAFVARPSKGPIQMLNLIRLRATAQYADGRDATGLAAYQQYGREANPIFSRVGGTRVWIGHYEMQLIGPTEERWDVAFIAQYPSSDAMIEMLRDPAYRAAVKHRQAAVEDSRLIRFQPSSLGKGIGDH